MTAETWQAYLEQNFPGFLLPHTERHRLTRAAAEAFLDRLGLGAPHLPDLRAMSLLAAHDAELHRLATDWLPDLVRFLPSRMEVERRTWRGGFHGRLDIPATMQLHSGGDRSAFVTRARQRKYDLPENVFVRSLVGRSQRLLSSLEEKRLLHGNGWTAQAVESLAALRLLTTSTVLREIPEQNIEGYHVLASQSARHGAYRAALDWYQALSEALDQDDTERLADVLGRGALRPGEEPKRFEVAVLLTLLSGIEQRLAQLGEYEIIRDLIVGDREQVATFRCRGAEVAVYYDQSVLPLDGLLGPRDRGTRHYLDSAGRCRPDITVRVKAAAGREAFTVFEIKLSDSVSYVASGYAEAIGYRHEYDRYLTGWPKAVLVTSQPTLGKPRREDDVVAVAWNQLADSEIIDGMLAPMVDSAELRS
jgi:hypothetical protein